MVSILVPVYNAEEYLPLCVDSLISQTYSDLQIVLIDDGSTDGSWNILKQLALRDARIEIYQQSNQGVAATRNRLLEKVRGEFFLFVDSDDWIERNTIEQLILAKNGRDCDMVSFQMVNSGIDDTGDYSREEIIEQFLRHVVFNGSLCNKLIKSDLINSLQFDESVSYGEDALFIWRVLQQVERVIVIDQHLYHIGRNLNSLTRQRFNGHKFSAYNVWNTICEDTDELWPQYSELAHARFACEMTKILRDAVLAGYRNRSELSILQWEVNKDKHLIKKTGISTSKMWLFAWLVSRHYSFACFLSKYISFK